MTQSTDSLSLLTVSDNTVDTTTALLKAMANENRVRILALLIEHKELSVTSLQQHLKILSQSALSQHLAILRGTGLVQTRRDSQTIFYSINSEIPGAVLNILIHNVPE